MTPVQTALALDLIQTQACKSSFVPDKPATIGRVAVHCGEPWRSGRKSVEEDRLDQARSRGLKLHQSRSSGDKYAIELALAF